MGRRARGWLAGVIAVVLALSVGGRAPYERRGDAVTLRGGPGESRPIETAAPARGAWREPAFPPGDDAGP